MAWLDRRQGVLAQNIANADTPGYRPQDLKAFDSNALNSGGHACSGDTTAYYGGESRQRRIDSAFARRLALPAQDADPQEHPRPDPRCRTNLALGLPGRLMPQLNVFFFGMPRQISLQLFLVMITLSGASILFLNDFANVLSIFGRG